MERAKHYLKVIIEIPMDKADLKEVRKMLRKGGFKEYRFEFGYYTKIPQWVFKSGGEERFH